MRHHSQETAPSLYVQAAKDAFRKLDPRVLVRNPVMFVVAVGCVFTTASFFSRVVTGADAGFSGQISLWLWFTVLFANFAEALAEGRGKAQADTLRSARTDTVAHRLLSDGTVETVSASELAPGDRVVVEAGDMARLSKVWPPWTNPPSPASRLRSSVNPAATAARLPAGPRCFPTASS